MWYILNHLKPNPNSDFEQLRTIGIRIFWLKPNFDLKCLPRQDERKYPILSTKNAFGWQVYENWWQTFSNCLDNWVLGVSLSKSPFFLTYLLILKILSVLLKNSKGVIYVGVISLIRDSFFKMITHQPLLYPFRLYVSVSENELRNEKQRNINSKDNLEVTYLNERFSLAKNSSRLICWKNC